MGLHFYRWSLAAWRRLKLGGSKTGDEESKGEVCWTLLALSPVAMSFCAHRSLVLFRRLEDPVSRCESKPITLAAISLCWSSGVPVTYFFLANEL